MKNKQDFKKLLKIPILVQVISISSHNIYASHSKKSTVGSSYSAHVTVSNLTSYLVWHAHQISSPHTDALGLCSQDTAEQKVCLSHSPLPFPSAYTPRNRLPSGSHHAGFCSTFESKWILSSMPKLVRYTHKGPRGLCLSNSGYLHFYFNLDDDE